MAMDPRIAKLHDIRKHSGARRTHGLPDDVLGRFLAADATLGRAIDEAAEKHAALRASDPELAMMEEAGLVEALQADFVNFYAPPTVNPYVALAARGPWIVTTHGGVLHDSGGYGMLGAGHGPDDVIEAMAGNWVMANVMTASLSQKRLADRLKREIGHTRAGGCPYARFICMNSGSEGVAVAARIVDVNAKRMTDPGGRYAGRPRRLLGLTGGFHGRTTRPAQWSDSCLGSYKDNLASFRDRDNLITVEPNDLDALRAAFAQAEADGVFLEAMFMEPVMGEGDPGRAVTRAFYDLARQLTRDHGALLLMDSIQAGFRATGCLSVTDYPGFQGAEPPDMETYSKALNAGQYPLSVLALTQAAADLYVRGVYGNTMTTNPRALEVACVVLDNVTDALRQNIVARGHEFVEKFQALQADFPDLVTGVEGTGLLLAVHIDPDRVAVVGFEGLEVWCRLRGLGVVHGGDNALRFTPHFRITSAEIDMMVGIVRDGLSAFRSSLAAPSASASAIGVGRGDPGTTVAAPP